MVESKYDNIEWQRTDDKLEHSKDNVRCAATKLEAVGDEDWAACFDSVHSEASLPRMSRSGWSGLVDDEPPARCTRSWSGLRMDPDPRGSDVEVRADEQHACCSRVWSGLSSISRMDSEPLQNLLTQEDFADKLPAWCERSENGVNVAAPQPDVANSNPITTSQAAVVPHDLASLKMTELKSICKSLALKIGGKKDELVQRIQARQVSSDCPTGTAKNAVLESELSRQGTTRLIEVDVDHIRFSPGHDVTEITNSAVPIADGNGNLVQCVPSIGVSWPMPPPPQQLQQQPSKTAGTVQQESNTRMAPQLEDRSHAAKDCIASAVHAPANFVPGFSGRVLRPNPSPICKFISGRPVGASVRAGISKGGRSGRGGRSKCPL